jgi:type IV secretory pathway TrbF-like protein
MKKIWAACITAQLLGCASLKPLPVVSSNVEYQQKADDVYQIASQCWNQATGLVMFGTAVSRYSQVGQEVIEARYVSGGEAAGMHNNKLEPFIRLIVQPTASGSTVTIYEKPMPYLGKSEHIRAAMQWANGKYQC